jgi:hypothetical protein
MKDGDSDEELEFESEEETEEDSMPFTLDQESYPEFEDSNASADYIEL